MPATATHSRRRRRIPGTTPDRRSAKFCGRSRHRSRGISTLISPERAVLARQYVAGEGNWVVKKSAGKRADGDDKLAVDQRVRVYVDTDDEVRGVIVDDFGDL